MSKEKRYKVYSEQVRRERRYYFVYDALTRMTIAGSYDKQIAERICSKRNALHRAGGKGMIVMPAALTPAISRPPTQGSAFSALCVVEKMSGLINRYIGVICYLPENSFKKGDKVRVEVSHATAQTPSASPEGEHND